MDEQPDCYVAGALAAMLRVSRVGGLAPLKFVRKRSGWRVSFSPRWGYYGYFIVTISIVTTISALIADFQLKQEQTVRMATNTRCIVWIIDVACMLLIAGTSVYGAPAQMRAMIACLNRIQKINVDLNVCHWPMQYEKKNTLFFFLCIAATVMLTVVDFVLMLGETKMNQVQIWISVMYSFYYYCYWILQLREMNFVIVTLHVMYCLRGVNDSLKNLLRTLADSDELPLMTFFNSNLCKVTNNKLFKVNVNIVTDYKKPSPDGIQKKTNHHKTVRRIALAYANTCDVVRDVDSAHGLIVLMLLGSFLLHLVCTPYYVINFMFEDNYSVEMGGTKHMIYVGVQTLWCLYHVVNLLVVIEPCHLTQMEMKTTFELVSHLMRCTDSIDDPLATELELFFKQLFLNQASYSAMHVATISRSLVATILGTITTYLVIILQL